MPGLLCYFREGEASDFKPESARHTSHGSESNGSTHGQGSGKAWKPSPFSFLDFPQLQGNPTLALPILRQAQ